MAMLKTMVNDDFHHQRFNEIIESFRSEMNDLFKEMTHVKQVNDHQQNEMQKMKEKINELKTENDNLKKRLNNTSIDDTEVKDVIDNDTKDNGDVNGVEDNVKVVPFVDVCVNDDPQYENVELDECTKDDDSVEHNGNIEMYEQKVKQYEKQLLDIKDENQHLKNNLKQFQDESRCAMREIILMYDIIKDYSRLCKRLGQIDNDKKQTFSNVSSDDSFTDLNGTDDEMRLSRRKLRKRSNNDTSQQRSSRKSAVNSDVSHKETLTFTSSPSSAKKRRTIRSLSPELVIEEPKKLKESPIEIDLTSDDDVNEPDIDKELNKSNESIEKLTNIKIKKEFDDDTQMSLSTLSTSSMHSTRSRNGPQKQINSENDPKSRVRQQRAIRGRGGRGRGRGRRNRRAPRSKSQDSDSDDGKSSAKKQYRCTFATCKYTCDDESGIKFHIDGHRNAKFKCPYCFYTGVQFQGIKRHMMERHKERKIYECGFCRDRKKTFADDIEHVFRDHIKDHYLQAMERRNGNRNGISDKELEKKIDDFVQRIFINKAAIHDKN